jgi:hypothetical protein
MSPDAPTLTTRVLCVLWPSFVMAGVLEMLVFSMVDPAQLHWFGGELLGWSNTAVYSVAFLVFWLLISTAGAVTQLLANTPPGPDPLSLHRPR